MSNCMKVCFVAVMAIVGSLVSMAAIADPYVDCNNPRTPSFYSKCKVGANDVGSDWVPTSKPSPLKSPVISNPRHPAYKRS